MKKHLKIINYIKKNVMLNLFQHLTGERSCEEPNKSLGRRNSLLLFSIFTANFLSENTCFAAEPIAQNGLQTALFKFFMAMLGVLVSALAIFIGLKFYKKFVLKNDTKTDVIDYNNSLESPKDFKEAINIFLDKTDK